MAPIIKVSHEVLKTLNPKVYTLRNDLENSSLKDSDKFIYVPSLKLYFSKERTLYDKNWFESHKELQSNCLSMPTIPEFIEFLKYVKTNSPDIYKEITEVRNPWRGEWLDADFKVKGKDLYINYNHILDKNGNLVPQNSEVLDKDTLMEDKTPGISLEDYILKNHTSQGLPNKKVKSGDLYYWYPRSDNNSVACFGADSVSNMAGLCCSMYPSSRGPSYWRSGPGVFAVKSE